MQVLKGILGKNLILGFVILICLNITSCKKTDYPCPGLGQANEADLSKFDESGELKNGKAKRRVNKKSGMVNKKTPKKLRVKQKTSI